MTITTASITNTTIRYPSLQDILSRINTVCSSNGSGNSSSSVVESNLQQWKSIIISVLDIILYYINKFLPCVKSPLR